MALDLNTLKHIPCSLLLVDQALKPIWVSRKGFGVFGMPVQRQGVDLEGLNRLISMDSLFLERASEAMEQAQRPGAQAAFRWERGERIYQVDVKAIHHENLQHYALLFDDVTQQVRACGAPGIVQGLM